MPSAYANDTLEVLEVRVQVFEEPGGYTLDDILNDVDFRDGIEPIVSVLFQEGSFASDLKAPNASMKTRGHSTRMADQKSFKIKLSNDSEAWRGHRSISLNKHPFDLTRIRQKLSFDYIRLVPDIVSLRTQFVHLYVNGEDYGLFTQVEEVNKLYLINHGLDAEGYLYKAEEFEFRRDIPAFLDVEDPAYEVGSFEQSLEIRGRNDHAKLLAMLTDVTDLTVPIDDLIERNFERENYISWLAINIMMGNTDTNTQNFLLYSPSNSPTWYFIPWDYDGAWDFYGQPDQVSATQGSWRDGIGNWWFVPIHQRFLSLPRNREELFTKITQLRQELFTPERTRQFIDSYRGVIHDYLGVSPDVQYLPVSESENWQRELDAELDRIVGTIDKNIATMYAAIERPMPFFLGEPEFTSQGVQFRWDEAVDLQGDRVTYRIRVSKTPEFGGPDVIYEESGVQEVNATLPRRLFTSGTYYWSVVATDEHSNTQSAFDDYFPETGERYHGLRMFMVP